MQMVEYYISSNAKYAYVDDKFCKNDIPLLDENGDDINEALFKRFIKKETANFIHKNYSNIIVLIGAEFKLNPAFNLEDFLSDFFSCSS